MKFTSRIQHYLNRGLHCLESRPCGDIQSDFPVIFIVGPPRSGTTLLYQLLIEAFDIGYISNRHARWYGGISFLERIFATRVSFPNAGFPGSRSRRKVGSERQSTSGFRSVHGRTQGLCGPSECGSYWYQFFPKKPQYAGDIGLTSKSTRKLRCSLWRIYRAFGKPIVVKNVMNSGRLRVLEKTVPNAVFIEVRRDSVSNGESILEARKRATGRYDKWWSLEPKGYQAYIDASPEVQVAKQVELTRKMIEEDRPRRCISVAYEDFADNPHCELQRICRELNAFGLPIRWKDEENVLVSIPDSFEVRKTRNIPDELAKKLAAQVELGEGGLQE